ncbi:MAG: Asp-tRNA(Asn)/Glu-tRNA(Gln) amidotransferase subunit GatB [Nitrososphaerales archaeon]
MSEEVEKVKIGLEVHCQLTSLKTKLFCSSSADYRGRPPNTNVCPVCIGTPGSLPVLNRKAIYYATMVALALNFELPEHMLFFRKNYFYPDMSKNFQITQYDRAGGVPFATDGWIRLDSGKKIRIGRMQLEEDPAKLSYDGTIESSTQTFVDYNRAGVALIELVTEPDLESPREAREFLNKLSSILEHLGVSDLGLEGSVRCDANISLAGGRRVEVKNISSFKEVERALSFEMTRQKSLTSKGISIAQETRHWDDVRRITISLRLKEEEQDYRYFPEADLVPVVLSKRFVEDVKKGMPELPGERGRRFQREYNLSGETAQVLVREKALADFFEESVKHCKDAREAGSWLAVDLQAYLNETGKELSDLNVTPKHIAKLVNMVRDAEVSRGAAKTVFLEMLQTGRTPRTIAEEKGLKVISDLKFVEGIVEKVLRENPQAVQDAVKDEKAINFLLGQIMRATRGRVDPAVANRMVRERLSAVKSSE